MLVEGDISHRKKYILNRGESKLKYHLKILTMEVFHQPCVEIYVTLCYTKIILLFTIFLLTTIGFQTTLTDCFIWCTFIVRKYLSIQSHDWFSKVQTKHQNRK